MKTPLNKIVYLAFLLLGLYHGLIRKDYMQAASCLGIGLAFDPFNTDQKWSDRPKWQKAVLLVNLALMGAMFGFGIGLNDR